MADEKKKEEEGEEGKKKGLPPIVMIAIGALVGGAGVVFAIPPKTVEVPVEEPHYEDIDVTHPDVIKKEFNPRTRAGKGVARVSFKFVYTVREDLEHDAYEQIKSKWDEANSRALLLFKTRSMEELTSEAGIRLLEHDLIEEMDKVLFGDSEEKLAKVTRVMWIDWLLQ
ncbi:MAG: hypothetical protein AB8H80_02075 [Planctomycetota bacterium]